MVAKEGGCLSVLSGGLMVLLLLWLAICGLASGMHFSGGALIPGILIMLLWAGPLALMLLTDRPVERPSRSPQAHARMAKRLRNYRVPGTEADEAKAE